MALDAAMLEITSSELLEHLNGSRVEKIYMPTRDEVLFLLRAPGGLQKLFVSARSGAARIHITQEEFEYPATPPGFCMLLRKYLSSGRITGVRSVAGERIIFLDIEALNEMGDRAGVTVSVELMGRYSNLVLVGQDGRVIDALKRIDAEQSDKRQLLPGLPFTMPPAQDKLVFSACTDAEIARRVAGISRPLSAALLDCIAGLGPVVCREIAFRTDPADPDADRLDAGQAERLAAALALVRRAIAGGDGRSLNIVYEADKPLEFSFLELTQYAGAGEITVRRFNQAGALLDSYYAERDRAERRKTRSNDLTRQVNALVDRARRKQAARLEERDGAQKAEMKKLYGELINANLHQLKKGMASAELLNYYDGSTLTVPLDVTRTPAENAQKYYKEYRKLHTAAQKLEELLVSGTNEIEYLQSVQYEIGCAATEEEFLLIRKELKEAGYLRGFKYKEQKNKRRAPEFLRYRTSGGLEVLVGRNNAANDRLTLKVADRRDLWFHIKDAPGSHVVLVCHGAAPADNDLTEAAMLAALHSSVSGGAKVEVDYTAVKNVRKTPGQKAGMVFYDRYQTALAAPDEALAKQLAVPG